MHRRTISWALRAGALALTLVLPSAAQAATAPGVTTGGAANVAQQTARLTGAVDPNGAVTGYQFQYGTTSAYGAVTAEQTLSGDGKKTVTADISGLAPATTYHYRLIAHNSKGLSKGADRTFKTKTQPLGVTFTATPNPLLPGATTTLAGQLTGTGNGGREVVLQSNPFPYTQGFKADGNTLITDALGNFSFGLRAVPFNTQYRVALPDKPSVVSPIVVVSVAVRVSTHLGTRTVTRGHKLTFQGSIRPAVDGTPIAIQKLNSKNRWVTIAGTVARHNSSASSVYSKKVTIRSGGKYRVYAGVANGMYVPNTGSTVTIHTR
ncbi:MAG TPA: fibronectin type III domain-containing protein [Baekduia sp.]|nr:fibronectin type III domain-containing protein [Baekduia sp.]